MIDNFSLGLTHALMLLAAWRLLRRPDLDDENAAPPGGWGGGWDRPLLRDPDA